MKFFGGAGRHASRGNRPATHKKSTGPERISEAPMPAGPGNVGKKHSKLLVALIVLGALVLLTLIGLAAFKVWAAAPEVEETGLEKQTDSELNREGDVLATPPVSGEPTIAATPEPEATPVPTSGRRSGVYTMLVVGQDVAGMNTDTIMVGMFDTEAGKLNIVSIPRDLLVNVSWSVKKVNSIYGMAGTEEGLVDGISDILGYKVDNYAVVNVYAVEQVIDAIGGVYFDVPMHMSWGDPTIGRSYDIPAGEQWLDGHNSMGVLRFRRNTDGSGYPTGDLGRVETQQKFAMALARQMLKLGNIPNLSKIIDIVLDNLKTDLTASNIAFFAQEFLKLSSDDINFYTLPYEPVYIKGGSYVSLRTQDWLTMLNDNLNPYYETITESNLDVLTFNGGSFYATTGILAGGYESFYDYTQLTS
ncbi:MAG: LytR family transcriptional regulator [Ruminococcaceae bacterium]|nr:LytR family transcriptional regulator [Oscillospiraceae bacterium]